MTTRRSAGAAGLVEALVVRDQRRTSTYRGTAEHRKRTMLLLERGFVRAQGKDRLRVREGYSHRSGAKCSTIANGLDDCEFLSLRTTLVFVCIWTRGSEYSDVTGVELSRGICDREQ